MQDIKAVMITDKRKVTILAFVSGSEQFNVNHVLEERIAQLLGMQMR